MAVSTPILAKINPSLSGRSVIRNMCFVSGASILGDLGCQTLESMKGNIEFKWDAPRTMRMGISGAFILAPMSLTWNLCAERVAPGRSLRAVLIKMGISMGVIPPMIGIQFTSLTLMEGGKSMEDVQHKLFRDLTPTIKNAYCYWPVVSVMNTLFVSVINRPAMSSFAGVFWNIYMSYQANHNGLDLGEVSEVLPLVEAEPVPVTAAQSPLRKEMAVARKEVREGESNAKMSAEQEADAGKDGKPMEAQSRKTKRALVRKTTVVSM